MKSTEQTLIIAQADGLRQWRGRAFEALQPLAAERRSAVDWVGLPTRSVVSLPMRLDGLEVQRRAAAASLELEAVGFADQVATAGQCEIQAVGVGELQESTMGCWVQAAVPESGLLQGALDARFAPASWFRSYEPGVVQLWRESDHWVAGLPDGRGALLHAQALCGRLLDADMAAQLRCVMASLEVLGVDAHWGQLLIFDHPDPIPTEFSRALDLQVSSGLLETLKIPQQASRLVPLPIVEGREQRRQRRMTLMGIMAVVVVVSCALGAFALRVLMRERSMVAERARLREQAPQLDAIRDARATWQDLAAALRPDEYPVETIFQLVGLMPAEGIRVTRFELNADKFSVDGEATSLGHGVEFRDKLIAAPAFKKWTWNFPQPQVNPDGRAMFNAIGTIESAAEANPEEEVGKP